MKRLLAAIALLAAIRLTSAQQADTSRNPLGTDPAAAAAGRATYDQTCASCHGPAGRGDRGPALDTGAFARGGDDGALFHTIRTGVPGSQMPAFPRLTDDQVWQIVSYIRTLGRRRPAPAPPSLVVATTRDGRQIRGIRRNEDTFSIQIADAGGSLHSLDKSDVASVRVEGPAEPSIGALPESMGVSFDRLVKADAEPHNWLMYWGDFRGTHYSALKQIDAANVARLQAAWTFPMPGDSVLETTPLVVDGVMYATQPGAVVALDARTGRQIWRYTRTQKVRSPYEINPFNRGVAILGHRLFVGTLDAAVIALDSRTGVPLWETQVADSMLGHSLTSAPLVVKDKVLVGITGGEFGARGFLDAYDAATGRRLWRWYSVPARGEFGNDTSAGDSWQHGGSPMWLTGSYDPELNLVYWTVGNPGPQIDRSARAGDNLFSDSVVALNPDTGQRVWHYQFTPNDGHDWDSCQDVVLVDRVWHGERRKLLLHADRNGLFYVIDRTNGTLLSGTPFVYVNWFGGFDANGRPKAVEGSNSSADGSFLVYPTLGGGTNFQAPSYSAQTGLLYLEYSEGGQRYVSTPAPFESGRQYIGRAAPAANAGPPARRPGDPEPSAGIKAIDPETGRQVWDFKIFQGSLTNGLLATAGNVLFGSLRDGNLVALDAATGKHLWHFQTGANMAASPISYGVGGRQFVAVAAGNVIYAFALPSQRE